MFFIGVLVVAPFDPGGRLGKRLLHRPDQLDQVEGLGEVFESAPLGRLDRRQQGVLRAHHNDPEVGPELANPRQQIEPVLIGQDHVGDTHIAFAVLDPFPQRRGIGRRPHRKPVPCQGLGYHHTNGLIIVGQKNRALRH